MTHCTPLALGAWATPAPSRPNRTCGRERVTRPHLGVVSAVRCAVLDFRTGNTCRNRSTMTEKPWETSPERLRVAGSGSYVDNNSTPTMVYNPLETQDSLSISTSWKSAIPSTPLLCATIVSPPSCYARQSRLSPTIPPSSPRCLGCLSFDT